MAIASPRARYLRHISRKLHPTVFESVTKGIYSGWTEKPIWYDAMKRMPPDKSFIGGKPPKITFPEDKLYHKLLKLHPMLELERHVVTPGVRSLATRFAQHQWRLIEHEAMEEEAAFHKCEEVFKDELLDFEKRMIHFRGHTQFVRMSGIYEVLNKRNETMKQREEALRAHLRTLRELKRNALKVSGAQETRTTTKDIEDDDELFPADPPPQFQSKEEEEETHRLRRQMMATKDPPDKDRGEGFHSLVDFEENLTQQPDIRMPTRLDRYHTEDPFDDMHKVFRKQAEAAPSRITKLLDRLSAEPDFMKENLRKAKERTAKLKAESAGK